MARGRHTAARHRLAPQPQHRWFGRGRTRAMLSVGLVFGLGAMGTLAYWTDTAAVTGGTITSGSMDLQIDSNAVGLGTGYSKTSITWSGLTPNERKAFNLVIGDVGNPPLAYTATATRGTTPSWTFVGTPINVQLFTGTAVADATYPIQESCTGASLGSAQAIDASDKALITTAQTIAPGGTQSICVVIGLDSAADNSNQSKTGSVTLKFTASQATS